jgi:hypothetical protein
MKRRPHLKDMYFLGSKLDDLEQICDWLAWRGNMFWALSRKSVSLANSLKFSSTMVLILNWSVNSMPPQYLEQQQTSWYARYRSDVLKIRPVAWCICFSLQIVEHMIVLLRNLDEIEEKGRKDQWNNFILGESSAVPFPRQSHVARGASSILRSMNRLSLLFWVSSIASLDSWEYPCMLFIQNRGQILFPVQWLCDHSLDSNISRCPWKCLSFYLRENWLGG